jgi:hypothetical protein
MTWLGSLFPTGGFDAGARRLFFKWSSHSSLLFVEHDPLRKPVPTFRDHALDAAAAQNGIDFILSFNCLQAVLGNELGDKIVLTLER